MTRFNIWFSGDPDVGIPGDAAFVDMHFDIKEVDKDYLVFVKGCLKDCFKSIWDDKRVYVMTDEETEE